jgi:hypothetical protein
LSNQVREYEKLLQAFGVRDHQVKSMHKPVSWIYKRLGWRVFLLFVLGIPALPGLVIHAPIVLVIRNYARAKAKRTWFDGLLE